jgi:hypothetical protein
MKETPKNTNLHKLRAMGKKVSFEAKGKEKPQPKKK